MVFSWCEVDSRFLEIKLLAWGSEKRHYFRIFYRIYGLAILSVAITSKVRHLMYYYLHLEFIYQFYCRVYHWKTCLYTLHSS